MWNSMCVKVRKGVLTEARAMDELVGCIPVKRLFGSIPPCIPLSCRAET